MGHCVPEFLVSISQASEFHGSLLFDDGFNRRRFIFERFATRQNASTLPTSIHWSNVGRANRQTEQRFLDFLKFCRASPTVEYEASVLGDWIA
jgi:hypothetical protein